MTERLYYHDSFLFEFKARVLESVQRQGKHAIVLDRTAFYPTSGGQVHDTGKIIFDGREVIVGDVADEEDGRILHFVPEPLTAGIEVQGSVDEERRRDHIQQHSGQHVLSAAFIELFNMPTVSFHMGEESCTIDLQSSSLSPPQVETAERRANLIMTEDRPVTILFVPLEEARRLGLRKLPPKQTGTLRLIDIQDYDLTACGGTHVRSTGQIGAILLRKIEKVKQGMRVEFVCGLRAVRTAHADFNALTNAAGLLSTHVSELPEHINKLLEESRSAGKREQKLLQELAEFHAERMLASHADARLRVFCLVRSDRDLSFIKLLAQKLTAGTAPVIALMACTAGQTALVFARSRSAEHDMGKLMKEAMAELGGRGGGTSEMAQGGVPSGAFDLKKTENLLQRIASRVRDQGTA
ncbi:MAG TPA: alanine--tRNA ligase-related protein [Terriglobales bacterium]|nr:alanine--tRNA ligase-related protein [Terriglobales bacterium]